MNALRRLEQGGIRFELTPGGGIAWENTWRDDAPDEWLQPLMAGLRERRAELVMILQRRQEWIDVYDEWSERLATEAGDPARDRAALRRLAALAIAGQMPCYDGGQIDLGAAGWERVTERLTLSLSQSQSQSQSKIDSDNDSDSDKRIDSDGDSDKRIDSDCEESSFVVTKKETNEMGIKIEQTTCEAVPTGNYRATITEIEQVDGKFGPQLRIKSEINTGPWQGSTFLAWVSPRFSPRSKLYEWVEAALARAVPRTYTFDSDHLIGREVIAALVVRELDGGGEVNRVDRVRQAD